MLRDARLYQQGEETLAALSRSVRDFNYRLFAERNELHLIAAGIHLRGTDPYDLFDELMSLQPKNMDAGHAFYLGYELCKAMTGADTGQAVYAR